MAGTVNEVEKLLWSGRLDEAESCLETCDRDKMTAARMHLTHGHIYLLKLWISGGDSDARQCAEIMESAITTADSFLKNVRKLTSMTELQEFDTEDCKLVVAEATLFRAVAQLFLGQTVKGSYNFRAAFKEYEKELRNVSRDYKRTAGDLNWVGADHLPPPEGPSAIEKLVCFEKEEREYIGFAEGWRFGLGFFLLYISMAPTKLVKVLEVVGFVADRVLGYGLLAQAVSPFLEENCDHIPVGSFYAVHALLWFLFDYSLSTFTEQEAGKLERAALGMKIMEKVDVVCPNSVVWAWLRMACFRLMGDFLEGNAVILECFRIYSECNNASIAVSESRCAGEIQLNLLLATQFDLAHEHAKKTLTASETGRSSQLPVYSLATAGVVHLINGESGSAENLFNAAIESHAQRPQGEIETLLVKRLKGFRRRRHGWVAFGEVILSLFATEWLKPEDAKRFAESVLKAIEELEKDERVRTTPHEMPAEKKSLKLFSKLRAPSLQIDKSVLSAEPKSNELSIAYVSGASLLRIAAEKENTLLDRATKLAEKALSQSETDKWITVFANYELALVHKMQRKTERAKNFLDQARAAAKGFEAERNIANRVQRIKFQMAL